MSRPAATPSLAGANGGPARAGLCVQLILWTGGLLAFYWFLVNFGVLEQLGFDAGHASSVARNLLAGNGLRTSVIANEALFGQQTVPALQTIWPPGMPIASVLLHLGAGTDISMGFVVINAIAHLLTAVLVVAVLVQCGLRLPVALAAGLISLLAIPNWILVVRGHSEPVMAAFAVFMGLLMLLALGSRSDRRVNAWIALAIVAGACCFLIRYQSIALLGPIGIIAIVSLTGRLGDGHPFQRSLLIGGGLFVVAAGYIGSNLLIAGTATGSDSPFELRPLSDVAESLTLVPVDWRPTAFVAQLTATVVAAVLAVLLSIRRAVPHHAESTDNTSTVNRLIQNQRVTLLFSTFAIVAVVGLIASLTFLTPAYPWIARYFTPMIPMAVVAGVLVMLLASVRSNRWIQSNSGATALTIVALLGALASQLPAARLIEEAAGKPIQRLIDEHPHLAGLLSQSTVKQAPGDDRPVVLMSNYSAYLALHTDLPILDTPFPDPDKPAWDEYRVAQVAQQYGVTHVVHFIDYPMRWGRNCNLRGSSEFTRTFRHAHAFAFASAIREGFQALFTRPARALK